MNRPLILILCTGNSCRSQMAEGILRSCASDILDVASAGTKPAAQVHPLAVRAMAEIGIDISSARPRHLDGFFGKPVNTVVTVCDNARESCPVFPGGTRHCHIGFEDPAEAVGGEEAQMAVFRRVRDEIRKVFEAFAAGCRATETAERAS